MHPRIFLSSTCLSILLASTSVADTKSLNEALRTQLQEQERTLSAVLEKMPKSVSLLSRRGDVRVFAGRFAEAVADYEEMIAMDPKQDAPHWRLGIAYYFNGQFGKAARQFEKYHAYDGRDRENGVWKFFSQARAEGIEAARGNMLVYTQFDREPFPSVYKMLAGEMSPAAVLEEVEHKGLQNKPHVLFFAKYYAGVMEALNGRRAEGRRLVEEAVALFDPAAAGSDGPGYMWHCARLHAAELTSAH